MLNQILVELGASLFSDSILKRVHEIHWLDCGNGMQHLCYPMLSQQVLSSLQYYRENLQCFFHLTPYLYTEDLRCKSYAELTQLVQQLQSVGIHTWTHFYSHEFEWVCLRGVMGRHYGSVALLTQHFSLLYEFHYWCVCSVSRCSSVVSSGLHCSSVVSRHSRMVSHHSTATLHHSTPVSSSSLNTSSTTLSQQTTHYSLPNTSFNTVFSIASASATPHNPLPLLPSHLSFSSPITSM